MSRRGFLALALVVVACATSRRGLPLTSPPALTTESALRGRHVFQVNCYRCHPGGRAGLGPGLNNKPLPEAALRLQVRRGVGAMPGFTHAALSNRELDDLMAYLFALRGSPRGKR
jgi:mono/diheme cytochrome c family protein